MGKQGHLRARDTRESPRAVVTDAAERVGLHVIRALGRAGIQVVATEIADRRGLKEDRMAAFAGVLHVHSTYSDGVLSPAEIAAWAQGEGLDFVGITDHSAWARGDRLQELCAECEQLSGEVLLMPGVEFEHHGRHVLAFAPAECLLTLTDEVAVEEPEAVREAGGVTIWAHPSLTFDFSLRPGIETPYDGWEVWNLRVDGRVPCLPMAALRQRVARQRPLMAFAGLDLHRLPIAAMPTCAVQVAGPTLDTGSLLQALRQGHHVIGVREEGLDRSLPISGRLASHLRHRAIRARCVAALAWHRLVAAFPSTPSPEKRGGAC